MNSSTETQFVRREQTDLRIVPLGFGALILVVVNLLVIAGGIGLMTLINLRYHAFWRRDPRARGRLTLQTRLSLSSSAILILLGAAATFAFELDNTLRDANAPERVSWAIFHSVMTRTAGYNVVDLGDMNPLTLLVSIGLMFIGGCPGSMAGGIKTVTFVVLLLTAWSALRRRDEIQFWGRRLPTRVSYTATMLVLLAMGVLAIGVGLLMITEVREHPHHAPVEGNEGQASDLPSAGRPPRDRPREARGQPRRAPDARHGLPSGGAAP